MASCGSTSSHAWYSNSTVYKIRFSLLKKINMKLEKSSFVAPLALAIGPSLIFNSSIHQSLTSLLIYHTLAVIGTASCGSISFYTLDCKSIIHKSHFSLSWQNKREARRSHDLWLLRLRLPDRRSLSTPPSAHHSHLSWSITLWAWLVWLLVALPPPTPRNVITLFTWVVFLSLGKIKVEPREAKLWLLWLRLSDHTYFRHIHPPITHISLDPSDSESFVQILAVLPPPILHLVV
jgi:hypothetical protein